MTGKVCYHTRLTQELDLNDYRYTLRRWKARKDHHGSHTSSGLPDYHLLQRVDLCIRRYLHQSVHLMLISADLRYRQNLR